MKAYLDDKKLKTQFVGEVRKHQKADQLVKGTYGKGSKGDFKGCAVGCSIHSLNRMNNKSYDVSDHSVYEKELGIPEWLARLEDTVFEGLPVEESKKWPLRFSQAINVGANLEPVKWQFCAFILSENIERALTLDIADYLKKQVVDAIRGVLNLHEQAIKTGEWDESAAQSAAQSARSAARSAWSAAESAAESAARSAESAAESAWSAARSAAESAWSAARSAAESAAESAARSAARSAAESAAESAARSAAYTTYADKLIALLKAAK